MLSALRLFFCVLFLALFSISAQADEPKILTDNETANFVNSLTPVQAFADKLKSEGKLDVLKAKDKNMLNRNFTIYSGSAAELKEKFPDDHQALLNIVQPLGFQTVEDWGLVGDAVMAAYFAQESSATATLHADLQQQMPPEMLAKLPPQARAQLEGVLNMADALQNVPDENKKTVKPFIEKIQLALAKAEGHLP